MIKIGMCDDNLDSIKNASKFLESEIMQQDFNAEISLITDDQKVIFDSIYKKELDVLILDIDFKNSGKNGLDFAKDLRSVNKDFFLIFLSAHQRFIQLSFFVKVFDYLVKPINRETIEILVSRLKDEFAYNKKNFLHLNKWISIRTNEILYIEKIVNKSHVFTNKKTYTTTKNLNTLLKELPKEFRKCHRSYIVNESKITSIDKKNNYVYFNDNLSCPINSYFDIYKDT
jgi:DNA-binding LytR/AlgR family response regulator